jgi:hypothetical protein
LSQTRIVIGCVSVIGVIAGLLIGTDGNGNSGIGEPLGVPIGKRGGTIRVMTNQTIGRISAAVI